MTQGKANPRLIRPGALCQSGEFARLTLMPILDAIGMPHRTYTYSDPRSFFGIFSVGLSNDPQGIERLHASPVD